MQEFIEAHPVFAAKARMEKWKLKKITHTDTHTHTRQTKRDELWSSNMPHELHMVQL